MATFNDRGIIHKIVQVQQTSSSIVPLTTIYTAPSAPPFMYAIYIEINDGAWISSGSTRICQIDGNAKSYTHQQYSAVYGGLGEAKLLLKSESIQIQKLYPSENRTVKFKIIEVYGNT